MEDAIADYVERMARMISAMGLPPMAGRIWAYLLVCEPPEQTAGEVATALGASRGSISGMLRLLEAPGLVRRTTRRGDRREYVSVPPGAIVAVLESRLATTVAWRRLAEEGIELLREHPPASRLRLEELRDVYRHMERELPAMLERFRAERAAAAAAVVPAGKD